MTKDKYSQEYHELIDILNEHQKNFRQFVLIILSAFVFPLLLAVILTTRQTIQELKRSQIELNEKYINTEHRLEIDEIHLKRLYLNDFGMNPYERGGMIK